MVKVKEAVEIILKNTETVKGFEYVSIDNAYDRIVYEDVFSKIDIPSFKRSAMDGYGIVGDCDKYKIVESESELKECTCIRINTGFPIPEGVRAVAEVEIVDVKNGCLSLKKGVEDKRNFTFAGIEVKKGDRIVKKGDRLSVRLVSLCAYCGISHIKVFRKPIVGIITTGDEVVFPFEEPKRNTVYNCNYYILKGLVSKWFGSPIYFGHVKDNKGDLETLFKDALKNCDVVLSSGGVSKGSMDFTKEIIEGLGGEILFDKTTIKPGKPAVFSKVHGKIFFGLPGWPSALYTVAYLYLKPLLYKLAGFKHNPKELTCIIDEDMHSREGKYYFDRVSVEFRDGTYHAVSTGSQKTDNFYSLAIADGLVGIEEEKGDVSKENRVELVLFDD
ncbi:molybdopterin molybdotransferase MoeA [Hippea alviniae]|uniref:molybdopterin molybdotransferase MoeA n=1 Tax=Hippea alviniae TaxID=1279027 RepID=UPI0003B64996|nr:molybdopterin molybdotransferase MoeA [Hippea alviniae]